MRLALLLAITLTANACASADKADKPPVAPGIRDVDQAKVQQVEDAAAQRGVRVQWVNPPRKQPPPEGG